MPDSLVPCEVASEDVHLWLVFDDENSGDLLRPVPGTNGRDQADDQDRKQIPASFWHNPAPQHAAIIAERPEAIQLRDRLRGQALDQEHLLVAVQADVKPSASSDYREAFASVHNSYFVGTGAFTSSLLSEELADGVQTVSGIVQQTEDGSWTVGSISVGVDGRT
jgi:hypothetical protein